MNTTRSGKRLTTVWGPFAASFVLIVCAIALLALARGEAVSPDEQAQANSADQLIEARRMLELSTQDVVAVRMLNGSGFDGDLRERLAGAAADVQASAATIKAIADGNGPVADEAEALLDDVEIEVLEDPVGGSLEELFYIAEDAARYAGGDEVVTTSQAAVQQLSFVRTLPLHVVTEGIAGDISVNATTADASTEAFIEQMVEVVRTEGGWFGEDPATPLNGSEWIDIDEASEMFPAAASRLNALVAASPLVAYDAWMRDLGDSDMPPPFDLTFVLAEADDLAAELAIVIDELTADDTAARNELLATRRSQSQMFLAASAAAGLLAIAVFAFAARRLSQSSRSADERAKLAMTDALTGVGNRHELERRTRALTLDPRFDHHVVVMIDLDRFKMVNDVHGHAAGDAILVGVASQLQSAALQIVQGQREFERSVIRLGGDEFLLTVHGTQPFDLDAIQATLDRVRNDSIDYHDKPIDLGFSLGIAHLVGQGELADLMSAADLATYEDKATRAHERKDAFRPQQPELA